MNQTDPVSFLLDAKCDNKGGSELAKAFQRATSSLTAPTVPVSTDAPVSFRELVRRESNPDTIESDTQAAERKHVWSQAQKLRKKKCHIIPWQGKTKESLWSVIQRDALFKGFSGKLNECHCCFVYSADLERDNWAKSPGMDRDCPVMEVLAADGFKESDFILLFDGCSRESRSVIEKHFPTASTFPIMYSNRVRRGGSRARKVFAAAEMVELMYLKTLASRVKVSVTERTDDYQPPWMKRSSKQRKSAATTHDLSMVGVEAVSRRPRIPLSEKQKIWPDSDSPPQWQSDSVPLFWHESKCENLWTVLLNLLNIYCVVDFSPGSGCLGETCLANNVNYIAVTRASACIHVLVCPRASALNEIFKHCPESSVAWLQDRVRHTARG